MLLKKNGVRKYITEIPANYVAKPLNQKKVAEQENESKTIEPNFINELVGDNCAGVKLERGDVYFSIKQNRNLVYGGRFTLGPGFRKDWIACYGKLIGRIQLDDTELSGTVYGPDGEEVLGKIIIDKVSKFVTRDKTKSFEVPGLGLFLNENYRKM